MNSWCVPLWVSLICLLGCGESNDESVLGATPSYPIPGCETLDTTPCDVMDPSCQRRLFEIAVCLRSDEPGDLPLITRLSAEEYADSLRESAKPQPDPNHVERALTLFGLAQAGSFGNEAQIDRVLEFVRGVYRFDSKDILLIEAEQETDLASASSVLVHELVHLLQDREFDLMAFQEEYGTSYDARLATVALSEGEATLHQHRYAASALGLDSTKIDWEKSLESAVAYNQTRVEQSNSPFLTTNTTFPYAFGARYQNRAFARGGMAAVRQRWASPPVSTWVYLQGEALEVDFEPIDPTAPEPAADLELVLSDRFGPWATFLLLEASSSAGELAMELALAWRGDRFSVYGETGDDPAAITAAVWQIEFSDATSAKRAQSALGRLVVFSELDGASLTITVSSDRVKP